MYSTHACELGAEAARAQGTLELGPRQLSRVVRVHVVEDAQDLRVRQRLAAPAPAQIYCTVYSALSIALSSAAHQ